MAQLVLAPDMPVRDQALDLASKLQGLVPWCKVCLGLLFDFRHELT